MPPKGERRKQQIINTAKEMFIEKGFQSTHIGQVCEKLDIARGTVYQYFSNKKEILYALLDSVVEKIEDILDLDEVMEFMNRKPELEEIKYYTQNRISASLGILINEPIVIKLIFNQIAGIDKDVLRRVEESVLKIRNLISGSIEELKKWGIFKPDLDPKITGSMLFGGIMMLIFEHDRRRLDILDENTLTLIVNQYLNGTLK